MSDGEKVCPFSVHWDRDGLLGMGEYMGAPCSTRCVLNMHGKCVFLLMWEQGRK
jgi:hypothetical protein